MDENLREATEFPEKNETTAAKANEPKTKSIYFKVSAYDPRGIEQWLSERAAEGEFLLHGSDFALGEPRDCRCRPRQADARNTRPDGLGLCLPDEGRHLLYLARRYECACALAAPLHG